MKIQHGARGGKAILPYFGKRKQVTYHLNQSYWCFHILPSAFFFQAKFLCIYIDTHPAILKRYVGYSTTSWYSIDVSGNDRHILLFYKNCHFCHLLPSAKVGKNYADEVWCHTNSHTVNLLKCWFMRLVRTCIHTFSVAITQDRVIMLNVCYQICGCDMILEVFTPMCLQEVMSMTSTAYNLSTTPYNVCATYHVVVLRKFLCIS